MIKRIVVPLDQKEEAKTALNIAVWLSLLFEAKLLLLGLSSKEPKAVVEVHPAHGEVEVYSPETPEIFNEYYEGLWTTPLYYPKTTTAEPVEAVTFNTDEEQDLEAYLYSLQKEITGSHLHHKLPPGQVSQRIENGPLDEALKILNAEEPVDLVVLPAHQENGLRQLLLSSEPNQVLRHDRLPVIVVPRNLKISSLRQFENETLMVSSRLFIKPTKGHIVVTLDGTAQAEAALPLAVGLARKMNVSVYLLLVLPLDVRQRYVDPETSQVFKPDSDAVEQYDFAYNYLCHIQQSLIAQDINCHRIILEGKADQRIVNYIERTRPTLTILATHAYPKLGQLLLGSVAEKVIKASSRLILLVPNSYEVAPEEAVDEPVETGELIASS